MPVLAIAIISWNHGVFIKPQLLCESRKRKKFSHKSRITSFQGVKEYSHSYRLPFERLYERESFKNHEEVINAR